MKRETEERSSW